MYVLDGYSGLWIIDVTDPARPNKLGNINFGGELTDLAILENYAYITHKEQGLIVVDLDDPSSPVMVGNLPPEFPLVSGNSLAAIEGICICGR